MGKKRDRKKPPGTVRVAQVGLDAALVKQAPPLWTASQSIDANAVNDGQATSNPSTVRPTVENGFHFEAGNAGTTGSSEPTWPTTEGGTVVDNGITWKAIVAVDGKVSAMMEIQEKARELMVRWRETGDNEFRKAARRLVPVEGRPSSPDDREVARMRALIRSKHAENRWQATGIIADDYPERNRRSFRNSLDKKYIDKYGE